MNIPDETPETTVEDDIRAAMESVGAQHEDAVVPETPVEAPAENEGPERDEHGRFKAKETVETVLEAPQVEAPAETAEVQPDLPQIPQNTHAYFKDNWAKLDPALRDALVARESEVSKIVTRYDGERSFGRDIMAVVKPYEGLIRSLGAEPKQAISYLLNADAALRTGTPQQKQQMLLKVSQDYGIPLPNGDPAANTPHVGDPRLETVEQRINRLEMERQRDIQSRREQEDREVSAQIEAFGSDPANVHFEREDVRGLMASLMQGGQAANLADAYEKAVYAIPETRALHLEAQRSTEERKRNEQRAEQARKARQASPSVTGAPGISVPTVMNGNPTASVEDDVREAMRAVAGRA